MGHIPWKEVMEALEMINYNGAACIETFNPQTLDETCSLTYLNRKFAETPEELAREGMEFLKSIQ